MAGFQPANPRPRTRAGSPRSVFSSLVVFEEYGDSFEVEKSVFALIQIV